MHARATTRQRARSRSSSPPSRKRARSSSAHRDQKLNSRAVKQQDEMKKVRFAQMPDGSITTNKRNDDQSKPPVPNVHNSIASFKQRLQGLRKRGNRFVRWINSLEVTDPIEDLFESLRNGILLCRIVENFTPGLRFMQLNRKPMSVKQASRNIERALNVIWKKGVASKNMPSPEDIWNQKEDKVLSLVGVMFDVYAVREMKQHMREMQFWYQRALEPYGKSVFQSVDPKTYWGEFADGVAIICAYHRIMEPFERPSLSDVYFNPQNREELFENVYYALALIEASGIPLLWDVNEFMEQTDTKFLLYQLYLIYKFLRAFPLSDIPAEDIVFCEDSNQGYPMEQTEYYVSLEQERDSELGNENGEIVENDPTMEFYQEQPERYANGQYNHERYLESNGDLGMSMEQRGSIEEEMENSGIIDWKKENRDSQTPDGAVLGSEKPPPEHFSPYFDPRYMHTNGEDSRQSSPNSLLPIEAEQRKDRYDYETEMPRIDEFESVIAEETENNIENQETTEMPMSLKSPIRTSTEGKDTSAETPNSNLDSVTSYSEMYRRSLLVDYSSGDEDEDQNTSYSEEKSKGNTNQTSHKTTEKRDKQLLNETIETNKGVNPPHSRNDSDDTIQTLIQSLKKEVSIQPDHVNQLNDVLTKIIDSSNGENNAQKNYVSSISQNIGNKDAKSDDIRIRKETSPNTTKSFDDNTTNNNNKKINNMHSINNTKNNKGKINSNEKSPVQAKETEEDQEYPSGQNSHGTKEHFENSDQDSFSKNNSPPNTRFEHNSPPTSSNSVGKNKEYTYSNHPKYHSPSPEKQKRSERSSRARTRSASPSPQRQSSPARLPSVFKSVLYNDHEGGKQKPRESRKTQKTKHTQRSQYSNHLDVELSSSNSSEIQNFSNLSANKHTNQPKRQFSEETSHQSLETESQESPIKVDRMDVNDSSFLNSSSESEGVNPHSEYSITSSNNQQKSFPNVETKTSESRSDDETLQWLVDWRRNSSNSESKNRERNEKPTEYSLSPNSKSLSPLQNQPNNTIKNKIENKSPKRESSDILDKVKSDLNSKKGQKGNEQIRPGSHSPRRHSNRKRDSSPQKAKETVQRIEADFRAVRSRHELLKQAKSSGTDWVKSLSPYTNSTKKARDDNESTSFDSQSQSQINYHEDISEEMEPQELIDYLSKERSVRLREVGSPGSKYESFKIRLEGEGSQAKLILTRNSKIQGKIWITEIREVYESRTNPSIILRPHSKFAYFRNKPTLLVMELNGNRDVGIFSNCIRYLKN